MYHNDMVCTLVLCTLSAVLQHGKTALDFSQEDDVKEALLEHRFSAEVC